MLVLVVNDFKELNKQNILGWMAGGSQVDEWGSGGTLAVMPYLLFVIFLHRQNYWRIKITPKKRVNYDKIHSKLPIFCVITAKYTVNCQFFALNL